MSKRKVVAVRLSALLHGLVVFLSVVFISAVSIVLFILWLLASLVKSRVVRWDATSSTTILAQGGRDLGKKPRLDFFAVASRVSSLHLCFDHTI